MLMKIAPLAKSWQPELELGATEADIRKGLEDSKPGLWPRLSSGERN